MDGLEQQQRQERDRADAEEARRIQEMLDSLPDPDEPTGILSPSAPVRMPKIGRFGMR